MSVAIPVMKSHWFLFTMFIDEKYLDIDCIVFLLCLCPRNLCYSASLHYDISMHVFVTVRISQYFVVGLRMRFRSGFAYITLI